MATLRSSLSSPPPPPPPPSQRPHAIRRRYALTSFLWSHPPRPPPHLLPLRSFSLNRRKPRTLTVSSSSSSSSAFDDFSSAPNSRFAGSSKNSILLSMIQEIEPLDVTLVQKDVAPTTLDAMKRTISSMLGLLPSDRFRVYIEALWDPLSKLLVSSMMTGYTLRNAEYRLFLEQNLDIHDADHENQTPEISKIDLQGMLLDNNNNKMDEFSEKNELSTKFEEVTYNPSDDVVVQGLGELSPEVQKYILQLRSRLSSAKKELHEVKRKSAALQMQQFVGEEKNDLLDYLRSLQPEKVAELSEPTSPELKETIHSVVHGLLATLSPKIHSKAPPPLENTSTGTVNIGTEDYAELVENTSLQFQPHVSLTRDYLARLLFWCMLLGHHLRGLEYRMDLTQLLSLTGNAENDAHGDEQVA